MIPENQFGKTGHQSTRTLFGAAALWSVSPAESERTLETLLKYGVNHIDVAASYGEAELRVGEWMDRYRSQFFLATKTEQRTYAEARAEIHRSLERLRTDHLDLIQLHAVIEDAELETALGPGGALEAALDARQEGLVRFIGITSHTLHAPAIHLRALERFAFTSVLLPYNYPMMQYPEYAADFNRLAEVCQQREVAMQTIKSICRRPWPQAAERFASSWYEPLSDPADIQRAVGYVFGRPQLFLNTIGDVNYLPKVLEAASRYSAAPTEPEMQTMAQVQEMAPLWEQHAATL